MTTNFTTTPPPPINPQHTPDVDALARALSEAYAQLAADSEPEGEETQKRFEDELARLDLASRDRSH